MQEEPKNPSMQHISQPDEQIRDDTFRPSSSCDSVTAKRLEYSYKTFKACYFIYK